MNGIRQFKSHSEAQFIVTMRPHLLVADPIKYKDKDGKQTLNKDLRFIKLATNGKIPEQCRPDILSDLILKGKRMVALETDAVRVQDETIGLGQSNHSFGTVTSKETCSSSIGTSIWTTPTNCLPSGYGMQQPHMFNYQSCPWPRNISSF